MGISGGWVATGGGRAYIRHVTTRHDGLVASSAPLAPCAPVLSALTTELAGGVYSSSPAR